MTVFVGDGLSQGNLVVDAVYEGIRRENGTYADPLSALVNVANQGGFRYRGSKDAPRLVVLTSNLAEPDWPDELDVSTGRFVYYGDNREHGRELHSTGRFGNHLLRVMFDHLHMDRRNLCPPVLVFTALRAKRAFMFRGLAAPGFPGVPPTEDLVAVWKSTHGERFQNYRATFTVLDTAVVSREWINSARNGLPSLEGAPEPWKVWVETGAYKALHAAPTRFIRSRAEQLPNDEEGSRVIERIRSRFAGRETDFESCAAEVCKLLLRDVTELELTRPWRDGGRDAIGKLRLGHNRASILVTFALEAKCYGSAGVGVAEISRLISRIRYREFGVLVTTSHLDAQAYKEIVEDGHPVIVVCARDILHILREAGYATVAKIDEWLDAIDPQRSTAATVTLNRF